MKVALALPFLQRGYGIEHRTLQLARALPAEVERRVLCLLEAGPGAEGLEVSALVRGERIAPRAAAAVYESRALFRAAERRLLAGLGRDWIVDAQYHPMTSLRPRGRLVVTWPSVPPIGYAASAREARHWLRDRRAMLEGARRADLVVCLSRAVEREIRAELGEGVPTAVLPVGHGPGRGELGLARERRRVLSLGRFSRHKGHEDAILAFARARRALPERRLELLLVGTAADAGYLRSLRALAGAAGLREGESVHFVPDASDRMVELALATSDVFVSASRWEGFGMPLVEAQSAGLPAVAYDLWSHPEVVAEPERLVPEGDVAGLGDAIAERLADRERWEADSRRARRFAREGFAWPDVVARYTELLRSL